MLFRRVARETDSSCKRIRSPLDPFILGISVSNHRRKCKTCGCVSGRKGPSAAPELARTAWFGRKLTVERELESQVYSASRSHGSECFKSSIAQVGMVFAAPNAIRESS